jgi:hypothetical protein
MVTTQDLEIDGRDTVPIFAWRDGGKPLNHHSEIASSPAEILTEYLPITSLMVTATLTYLVQLDEEKCNLQELTIRTAILVNNQHHKYFGDYPSS